MIEVLRTKLFIPRPRKNLVARPRLVDCLNEGLDKKLTLIAAPAGFGKTTLLSEWIPQSPRCVTWLSLEQSDNDPARFWVYFIASLQRLSPQLGENALALLQSSQAPPTTSVVTILINEITAFEEVFAIVLDDYHTIESPSIHQSLTFLIEHLPGNMHVLMTTRVDPPLPIARLRVRDQLTEIRAHDLRFSEDEAAAFLTQVMGLELSVAQVAMLEIRTEGWIAGLQIAALSMQGRKDVSGFLRAFSGSHRHVLGYLAEEVINQQPDEIQNFLLQTSILNALCGPLCEAVTGEQGGQAILEKLEHANLFITPLDDERRWYRYHHLFAEVLQARLQQTQRIRIPQLHRRASTWFEGSGQVAEAIDHAISGEDFRRAGELIASAIPSYHFKGSVATLIKWIDRLPEVHLVESAELLSQKGWLLYLSGQIDLAQQHAAKARAYIKREVTPVAYGRLAFLNSQFAVFEGNIAGAIDYAFEALELIGDRDPYVRSLILTTLAMAQPVLGNTSDTIERLEEAARISEGLRQPLATLSAYAKYADQLNLHGRLQEGQKVCEHALGLFADGSGQPSPIAGIAFVSAAKLAYEENDLAKTDRYLREASIREKLLGLTGLTFEITYMDALLAWARGDVDKALRVVRHGCETADQMEQKGYISIFTLLETDLLLKSEALTAPNAWLEAGNRSNRDASSLFQIHENTVFARYLIWQNRLPEASHMLEELEKTSIRSGYIRYQLAVLVLQALLCERQGGPEKAIENLERAIQQAAPQKYRRVFLDEGEGIRPLLMRYQSIVERQVSERVLPESPIPLRFVEELLSEISPHARIEQTRHGTLSEPLSTRELEILRLIAAGRSNQEIAEILVIAVSTVKSHINNLYGKLGTNRRTEAIAIARDQGLLSG